MFRFLAAAALLAAAAAADGGDCAVDEESDAVGLLQAAGHASQKNRSEGWVAKEAKCSVMQKECGSACCSMMATCDSESGQCKKFMGGAEESTPKEMSCPFMYTDYGDKGCCPMGTLLSEPETCVPRTCAAVLQYNCSLTGTPECFDGGTLTWADLKASGIISGGDDIWGTRRRGHLLSQPTVNQTCTLDGVLCYDIWCSGTMSGLVFAPDCE